MTILKCQHTDSADNVRIYLRELGRYLLLTREQELTLTQVGACLNKSRERVLKLEKSALQKLRAHEQLAQLLSDFFSSFSSAG